MKAGEAPAIKGAGSQRQSADRVAEGAGEAHAVIGAGSL